MPDVALVDLLKKLVAIPSVNPHLADDPAIGTEKPMAECLAALLDDRGFDVQWHEITPGRPNVVGYFGPTSPRRSLLIESHLDTQGIQGMTVPPFSGLVRDGRLYGRGACDTKGPMAAALMALDKTTLNRVADAGGRLIYVGAVGEEKGNIGAEQLVDLDVGADEAVVLEPTELAIVHAHKGTLWFEVEVQGLAAHGSNPDRGVNAVTAMMRVVEALQQQVAMARTRHRSELLGSPSVNIGIVRGGTSINIVPDRCVIEVDRRTLPSEDNADILSQVRGVLEDLKGRGLLTGHAVRPIKEGLPFETTASSRLVRRLAAGCASVGVPGRTEGAAWYSDAGPFSRSCREVAVFGPGSIKQAHTVDEFIDLENLALGRAVLARFLNDFADEVAKGGLP